ncbi:MAG: endonuclease/exonuclease/phosphatase family protein [Myxococcales bacterium]|nr:endonuclease/exonuclease/phosphatase family protein [Myxococcales bacterium]
MNRFDLSVVTYNVLAQAYVKPERYPLSDPDALAAAPRRALLLDTLASYVGDVLCLQEVEPELLDGVRERWPDHTVCYGQKHGKPDGSAVIVPPGDITVIHHETLHFEAVEPGYDHVAVAAQLRVGDRALGVVSTHLRWQPRRTPDDQHLGRLQLLELLHHVEQMRDTCPAWVICGDFNALSESVVIREALDRGYRLSCRSQRPWDTVNIDGRRRKLDYLLMDPAHLRPHPDPLPKLQRDTPMPSDVHASDHLPVRVGYTWV